MLSKYRISSFTYAQLHKVLVSLGFERQKAEAFTAYRDTTHGAIIVLPVMSSDTIVSDPHLISVTNTIVGRGVTTTDEFNTLLMKSLPAKVSNYGRRSFVAEPSGYAHYTVVSSGKQDLITKRAPASKALAGQPLKRKKKSAIVVNIQARQQT